MLRAKIIYLITFIIAFFSITSAFADEKLVFSVDLVRHGNRTPLHEIPNAPYQWKEGLGELTELGKQQELQLGSKLREMYITQYHLLPDVYDDKTMYARSTDFKRAIDSADALLLGLYPISKRPNNSTIVVQTFPHNQDNILTPWPIYNIFAKVYIYFWEKVAWHNKTEYLEEKLELWRNATGLPLNNFKQVGQLADNLRIRQLNHIPFPAGISNTDASIIMSIGEYGMVNLYQFKAATYPMGFSFLNAVDRYFKLAMTKKTSLKYVLFLAHDSTIMSVMNTIGVPLETVPKYASRVNFSLFEDNNHYYVKIYYNDQPVNIRACGGIVCTIPQFFALG